MLPCVRVLRRTSYVVFVFLPPGCMPACFGTKDYWHFFRGRSKFERTPSSSKLTCRLTVSFGLDTKVYYKRSSVLRRNSTVKWWSHRILRILTQDDGTTDLIETSRNFVSQERSLLSFRSRNLVSKNWVTKSFWPSHPPGSSVDRRVHPDHLQVLAVPCRLSDEGQARHHTTSEVSITITPHTSWFKSGVGDSLRPFFFPFFLKVNYVPEKTKQNAVR